VLRFNKHTEKFDVPVKEGAMSILTLALDNKDTLWVGRAGYGLLKINTRDLSYKENKQYGNLYARLPHVSVTAIFQDKGHNIWCGSWDKDLYCYAGPQRLQTGYTNGADGTAFPRDKVLSFAEDAEKRIWMAGENTGVTVYDTKRQVFHNYRNDPFREGSLTDDHANVVYIDRSGIVWIGTNNGISVYNPLFQPFKRYFPAGPEKDLKIYDFYVDNGRRLWIGTSEGIYIKHPGKEQYEYRKVTYQGHKLAVTKFFIDQDSTFYLGTDYTLFRYNARNNEVTALPNTEKDPVMRQLINSRIVSVVRDTIDDHPVLLVSPYGHYLTYYDLEAQHWISRTDPVKNIIKNYNIKDHLIQRIYRDSGGVWIATSSFGLGYWNKIGHKAIRYLNNDPEVKGSISNNNVYDIMRDSANNLWISTYGGGLNHYNKTTGKFSHIDYSSNLTEGMQTDKHGTVWMICNGHVHKYDPGSAIYSCYDLPSLQKTNGLRGYIYKDKDNNLYASGENYYITFQPDMVKLVDYAPVVYLTDFKIFNQSFPHLLSKKTIYLDHTENYFSLSFSAPDFSGDNIQYAYMLKGFDKHWVDAGKFNIATYSNLPGGKYEFQVQARNWKGGFNGPYQTIEIVVIPPFWMRWWFYVLLCIVSFLIGYGIYRYQISIREKHLAIRNGIARDLHDQVGSTLGSIAVYSEVAKIFMDQQRSDRLTEVLDNITESANEMINEMGDIVWALNPKNDHFSSIVQRIETYAQPICKAKDINFSSSCAPNLLPLNLGMKERKNLFLIIKEAIHNSVKYAQCKNITVEMLFLNQQVRVKISDDGVGFDTTLVEKRQHDTLRGNGLPNMQFRARELGGDVQINSQPGKGTSIIMTFNYVF
jgi:ligand-binding sensor domain-containing protein/two-component sensor histidine kinase